MGALVANQELSKADAKALEICLANITTAYGHVAGAIIVIGRELAVAHEIHSKVGCEGRFSGWIEDNCRFSTRSAYRYLAAFRAFGNCDRVSLFADTAMYELAKNPEAAAKAIALANRGNIISHAKAIEIIEELRPTPEQDDEPEPEVAPAAKKCEPPARTTEARDRQIQENVAADAARIAANRESEQAEEADLEIPPAPSFARVAPKKQEPNEIGQWLDEFDAFLETLLPGKPKSFYAPLKDHFCDVLDEQVKFA